MSLFVTLLPREDSCLSISSALFSWLISEVINSPDSSLNLSTSFMWNCSPLSSFESILTFLSGSITVCTSLFSCVLTTVCSTFIVSSWSFIVSSTSLFMTVLPREDWFSCDSFSWFSTLDTCFFCSSTLISKVINSLCSSATVLTRFIPISSSFSSFASILSFSSGFITEW